MEQRSPWAHPVVLVPLHGAQHRVHVQVQRRRPPVHARVGQHHLVSEDLGPGRHGGNQAAQDLCPFLVLPVVQDGGDEMVLAGLGDHTDGSQVAQDLAEEQGAGAGRSCEHLHAEERLVLSEATEDAQVQGKQRELCRPE